ncbi:uncharacterized protein LDX57_004361 [Aspergillus melleus]|uniref:uncharacterized protein n=1 Tax=Aspergillus melleus TaxID=138277 RepID=UPI001E8DBADC|nr:uncharacterized protein LDX57_004361 [Aspergillus melleus]KAH8426626.1 hypothetical protein LDX57_004361 [Aspergillus melleus]
MGSTTEEPLALDPQLPQESKILSASRHGTSFWTQTGRIDTQLSNGTVASYFIKIVTKGDGQKMVQGEYESMKAIHGVSPTFAPKPLSWGSYDQRPHTHFFLCEYREMKAGMPDPEEFGARLAELHRESKSPNGAFGFHIDTWSGNIPQQNEWEASWEVFFAKNMRWALNCEIKAKGFDAEFETLVPVIFEKVIPRLLRPLESEGRSVKPSLVHGDLWYANSGVDATSNQSLVFDACCFYAHNECKTAFGHQLLSAGFFNVCA